MTDIIPSTARLTEEDVARSAPGVRALVLSRLQALWGAVEPHITDPDVKPDPRFVEAGIRINDRLVKLFRLDQPQQEQAEATGAGAELARARLAAQIRELESRLPE